MINLANHNCICKEGCLVNSTNSKFSVYGNADTNYKLNNVKNKIVSKYIVDDCVLVNLPDEQKCDYLFLVLNEEKKDGYFIELKGADIPKAISQLLNSIKNLKANVTGVIKARIVCSKFHKAPKVKATNDYKNLRKLLDGDLEIKSTQFEDKV